MFQSHDVVANRKLIIEDVMNERLFELEKLLQSTGYAKQKSRLQADFSASLIPSKTLIDASPQDIKTFLVFKDAQPQKDPGARSSLYSFGKKKVILNASAP